MMDLLNHKFFNYFSDTGAKALAEYVEEIPYNDQTVVFEEGDPSNEIYLILEGAVELTKRAKNGQQIQISTAQAGDYFGEMGVLDDAPRSTRAATHGFTRLAKIPGAPLMRVLNQEPAYVTLQLVRAILINLRRTNDRLVEQSATSPKKS